LNITDAIAAHIPSALELLENCFPKKIAKYFDKYDARTTVSIYPVSDLNLDDFYRSEGIAQKFHELLSIAKDVIAVGRDYLSFMFITESTIDIIVYFPQAIKKDGSLQDLRVSYVQISPDGEELTFSWDGDYHVSSDRAYVEEPDYERSKQLVHQVLATLFLNSPATSL
jgi:hypothetical protein